MSEADFLTVEDVWAIHVHQVEWFGDVSEIPAWTFRRRLEELASVGRVVATGETRARRFSLAPTVSGHGDEGGA